LKRLTGCLRVSHLLDGGLADIVRVLLGRSCPEVPCDLIFEVSEWKSVWQVKHPKEAIPERAPPLEVSSTQKQGNFNIFSETPCYFPCCAASFHLSS